MQRRALLLTLAGLAVAPSALAQASALTQADAARGVREMLTLAANAATQRLGRPDGFFGDLRVRIPLPGLLAGAQRNLKPLGLSAPLDDLQLRMNRGAEAAMPAARRLLVDAIRGITLQDALSIVAGGDDSATVYLRGRTEPQLAEALRPPMQTALTSAGAFTALDRVTSSPALTRFGLGDTSGRLRTQIITFAVAKGQDGAFTYLAEEEGRFRSDPVRRTTALLRRVFGR
jgi:hypothetical protein